MDDGSFDRGQWPASAVRPSLSTRFRRLRSRAKCAKSAPSWPRAMRSTRRRDRRSASALLRLTARSDAQGLVQLACHLGALLATRAPWCGRRGARCGCRRRCCCTASSWCSCSRRCTKSIHWTAFRSRRLNDAVAWACGALLLLPPAYFRAFHFAHHRHTQDPGARPGARGAQAAHARRLSVARLGPALLARADRDDGAPRVRPRRRAVHRSPRTRPAIVREARLLLGLYALAGLASIALSQPGAALPVARRRPCSASRFCACTCSPSTPAVRWWRTCSRTRGPRAAWRRSAGSPGTCRTMPSTTRTRRCRSMRCRRRTALLKARDRRPGVGLCRRPSRDRGGPAPGRRRARSAGAQPERPAQLTHNGVAGSSSSRLGAIGSPQVTQ